MPEHILYGVDDRLIGGIRTHRKQLGTAGVHGDSMKDMGVLNGDIVLFEHTRFDDWETGVRVIEKVGDEEGLAAWALNKIVVEHIRVTHESECDDPIDWDEPAVVLQSRSVGFGPNRLDPSGQYRVRGKYLRALPRHNVLFVDADWIRCKAIGG